MRLGPAFSRELHNAKYDTVWKKEKLPRFSVPRQNTVQKVQDISEGLPCFFNACNLFSSTEGSHAWFVENQRIWIPSISLINNITLIVYHIWCLLFLFWTFDEVVLLLDLNSGMVILSTDSSKALIVSLPKHSLRNFSYCDLPVSSMVVSHYQI